MDNRLNAFLKEKVRERTPAIWGIGANSDAVSDILVNMGINNWVWIDKKGETGLSQFEGKTLIPPDKVNSDYYIFISSHHINEIRLILENREMHEWDDWIYAIEREYYEGLLEHSNGPFVPELQLEDISIIEQKLREVVKVIPYEINEHELEEFATSLNFEEVYDVSSNKRYRRKIIEYFLTEKLHNLLSWNNKEIFLDLGAAGSPYVNFLRKSRNIAAYALDLEEGAFSQESYYLCEDATRTHFDNKTIAGASMHSSFEMFLYNADTDLIKEMARILRRNAKLVIAPLYLHKNYLSTCSPNYYGKGFADEESLECIRTDCWSWVPLARFYDVRALEKRVLSPARECGFIPTVYSLSDDQIEKDGFVYLKFALELKKI